MNHQLYEMWILDPPALSDADRQTLQLHLAGCKECRSLYGKWASLSEELRTPVVVAPRPGFTRRWKASLAEKHLREERRQAWKFFLSISGATAAVFLIMVSYLLLTSTPAEWIQTVMRAVTATVGTFTTAHELTTTWLNLTPLGLNVVLWVALCISFCILASIWAVAIWKTAFAGVWNK